MPGYKSGGGLTKKQRKFYEGKAMGKTDYDAAVYAGYSQVTASKAAARIRTSITMQEHLRQLARTAVPPERAVRRLSEIISGTILTVKTRHEVDAQGQVLSSITERTESTDHAAALRALDMAAKWAGYVEEKPGMAVQVNQSVTLEDALRSSRSMWRPPTWLQRSQQEPQLQVAPKTAARTPDPVDAAQQACPNCAAKLCPHGLCPICDGCDSCAALIDPPVEVTP